MFYLIARQFAFILRSWRERLLKNSKIAITLSKVEFSWSWFLTWTMWDQIKEMFCKFSPERGKKPPSSDTKTNWLNVLCFYILGTLSFFNQEMLYTASEDILSGRKLPTATVLVSFVTPLAITKIIAPWFIQRIPYAAKVCFIALCMVLGLILIVFVEDIRVRLVGIALNALATGTAEVVFLGLTSFYPQVCISSLVAGTGMASLVSPLYYTGKRRNNLSNQLFLIPRDKDYQ